MAVGIVKIGGKDSGGAGGGGGGVAELQDRIGFGTISVNNITAGIKAYRTVPFDCTISAWYIETEVTGTIEIDVLKDMILPTSLVGAGTKPFMTGDSDNSDESPDWDTLTLTEGDILVFEVQAGSTCKKVVLTLDITST